MFADVILPLAIPGVLTYSVPKLIEKSIAPGMRVIVQVNSKFYVSVVVKLHNQSPLGFEAKEIIDLIDSEVTIDETQIKLWQWIAEYYMCTLGEVMKAALPSGMKPESETMLRLADTQYNNSTEIIELLRYQTLSISEIQKATGRKNIILEINDLLKRGIIIADTHLNTQYKPKFKYLVSLNPDISEEGLNKIFKNLEKSPKQLSLLTTYISFSDFNFTNPIKVARDELLKNSGCSSSILKTCVDKGIFIIDNIQVDRIENNCSVEKELPILNTSQQIAFEGIKSQIKQKPILLHGVTSSGKTEVYIKLIAEQLEQGKQVLYLLPEIALTTQIIVRLRSVFGDKIAVWHSKFNDAERVEIYNKLLGKRQGQDSACVILGARSALFLPFSDLSLIIVDEEHESTYKQHDPAPRYNARDCAVILGRLHNAGVLLGSATPSLESYTNALQGKYALVEMNQRFGDANLPDVEVVDIVRARKKKEMNSIFSKKLLDTTLEAINKKEQIIYFRNRRGFSQFIQCSDCGFVPKCEYCDVSMTYHKSGNRLVCHYCGYTIFMPSNCPHCSSPNIKACGFGTEKVEDELQLIFPEQSIERLDLDSTQKKYSYERILEDFDSGRTDILIGTQMITKGLDFKNVNLVGVLNADEMLNFPDFRAHERSFQLMSQVSGRAGRKNTINGKVIIQTSQPDSSIIKQVKEHDYKAMYLQQMSERKEFLYPPYSRLVVLTLKHNKQEKLYEAANQLKHTLYSIFGNLMAGPESPQPSKVKNRYLLNFRIKLKRDDKPLYYKKILTECISILIADKKFSGILISCDVDPM